MVGFTASASPSPPSAKTDNGYDSHDGDLPFTNTPVLLIHGHKSPGEAPPNIPPPKEPADDGSGPGPQSRHRTPSEYSDVSFVAPTPIAPASPCSDNGVYSEAQNIDDDLELDILDVGVEIIKGDMSIDKWLEQMTNVGCAGSETTATAELTG
ncbi:hypothetical protein LEL_10359 [Akanthomyces lecanii RCEF 1005]|uniref:Uncharacterized protein n=1 Tax=Akanthomyces lecanii RCEF 1005 TaxID=1081108 RepID=A0A167ZNP8_CORDF|nr:hypothetical protein LEL_10359 [Akanthomyces lecanii RCEF 1005]